MKRDHSKIKTFKLNLFLRTSIYSLLIILISLSSYFGSVPLVSNYLHDIESQTYDLLFLVRHNLNLNPKPPEDILIIGIDAVSIDKVGVPWPWPRQFHAALVDALNDSKVKSIFFDIIFDTISPLSLQTQEVAGDRTISTSSVDAGVEDDEFFAKAISTSMNVFLACEAEPLSKTKYHVATPVDTFLKALSNDVGFLGNTAVSYDNDNFVRRAKVVFPEFYNDPAISTSIPLRIAQKYFGEKAVILQNGYVQIGKNQIPGEFLINYYGPCGKIKTIPYWKALDDIYGGKTDYFKNKIILVGRSNLKASIDPFRSVRAPDSFATPFSKITPNFAGVEVQATILSNILKRDFIERLNDLALFALLLFVGLISTFIVYKFRTKFIFSFYFSILLSITYLVCAFILLAYYKISIPPTFPIYALITPIYLINFLDQHFIVDSARRRQAKLFQQLVSPQVAEEIEKMEQGELALGGTKREITALFTDIQNFTSLCEKIEPEIIVNILNQFFTEMVMVIHKHEGLVDKFIGDAIMALWGTPKLMDTKLQANLAVSCALAMKKELIQINKVWKEMGFTEDLNIRIGINTDIAITGNLGSPQRAQFSAIGDGVNVASRLEGVNKVYGTGILLSEKTVNLLDKNKFHLREVDTVLVPGKDVPIKIFELIAPESYSSELLNLYSKALSSYRGKNFSSAIKDWEECLKINPNDKPSKVMLSRAMILNEKLLNNQLENWNPAWIIENK